jgi:hypothetical protein
MRVFERAIIIDEPWFSMILAGAKVWEMRSRPTKIRGPVGLIRKGSGAVVGAAKLVGSLPPLSYSDFAAQECRHGIPPSQHEEMFARGHRAPWVVEDARPLRRPVPYRHLSGQQIWVRLHAEVDRSIQVALTGWSEAGAKAGISRAITRFEPIAKFRSLPSSAAIQKRKEISLAV